MALSLHGQCLESTASKLCASRTLDTPSRCDAVFAIAIALIACQQGFATTGGAEGVGRRTTSTVVTSLFALVLLDAAFTVAYQALGL